MLLKESKGKKKEISTKIGWKFVRKRDSRKGVNRFFFNVIKNRIKFLKTTNFWYISAIMLNTTT